MDRFGQSIRSIAMLCLVSVGRSTPPGFSRIVFDALGNIPGMRLGLNQLNGQLLDGLKGSELLFLECLEIHAPIILMMTRFRATGYDCVGR